MSIQASPRKQPPGDHDLVVSVTRGHTQRASRVFRQGQAERISVGSQGDWSVSGPGVLSQHLHLSFDGNELYAAPAEGAVYSSDRALAAGWTKLRDGAELRFGFGLLRVTHEARRAPSSVRGRSRAKAVAWALAACGVLISSLALARYLTTKAGPAPSSTAQAPIIPVMASAEPMAPAPREQGVEVLPSSPAPAAVARAPSLGQRPGAAYPQNVANRPVPRIGDKPWLISTEWRTRHERQLHAAGRNSAQVIFLGDSITEGWGVSPGYREHFARYSPLNLGLAGDMTQNVLWRVEHGALDGTQPRVVVLMIGVNNLGGGFTAEETADGVRATLAAVRAHVPAARVLLLGILPARQALENPLRRRIQETNQLLEKLVEPGHVDYHDLGSVFLETDGRITTSAMRDYLHPTTEGFERLSSALAPLLDPLLGAEPKLQ